MVWLQCECVDELCHETKERVEVCRPHVTRATHNESIVSCRVAEWICHADGVCSTALDYYHHYCRSMFQVTFFNSFTPSIETAYIETQLQFTTLNNSELSSQALCTHTGSCSSRFPIQNVFTRTLNVSIHSMTSHFNGHKTNI